jgi:hypothetical protein
MLEKNNVPSFINENDIPDSQAVGCAFRVIFFSSSRDGLVVSHGYIFPFLLGPLWCSKTYICEMAGWS